MKDLNVLLTSPLSASEANLNLDNQSFILFYLPLGRSDMIPVLQRCNIASSPAITINRKMEETDAKLNI